MAKVKAVYGRTLSGMDDIPSSLKIDGVEIINDNGLCGWRFEASGGCNLSKCYLEFQFDHHDIEFDGDIIVNKDKE